MSKPIIRLWDIETSLQSMLSFGLFNKFPIHHDNILQERHLICAAWKDLGAKRVHSTSILDDRERFDADHHDDTHVVHEVYKMLEESDAVIAHFGDGFDMKMLNARAIEAGLGPLPNVIQIDTYKMAKKKFRFNNYRLDYLGWRLCQDKKIKTDPELWRRCWFGEIGAHKEMLTYNKHDVNLLEKVYHKLAPYVPARINHQLFGDRDVCPLCGSDHINYRGSVKKWEYTGQRKYRLFQCMADGCGHYHRSRKSEPVT